MQVVLVLRDVVRSRFIVTAIDETVWAATDQAAERMHILCTVCNSSSTNNLGYVQCPVSQAQTNFKAIVKRKRLIEDPLVKADIDFGHTVMLQFSKDDSSRQSTDKRPCSQAVLACVSDPRSNKWLEESVALARGVLGPLPLCPVSQLPGYDSEQKPGAAARAAQTLSDYMEHIRQQIVFLSMFV